MTDQTHLAIRQDAETATSELPALMAMAEKAVANVLHGDHAQRKSGAGEKFWQFREYTPYDRPQDIDWRQSAKTDRTYIRQKEWQTTQTAMFWCNQSASMDFSSEKGLPTKLQTAKTLVLALAILMTRGGEQVGLFGVRRTGRSQAMLEHIGNVLCDSTVAKTELPDFTHHLLPKNCSFIQVGDFLAPLEQTEEAFKKLSGLTGNGLVIQVLDPAELELPYNGRVIFEDPANQTREAINHIASIREAYQQRVTEHLQGLEKLCAHNSHWDYLLHRTDQDISDTLTTIWARLSR